MDLISESESENAPASRRSPPVVPITRAGTPASTAIPSSADRLSSLTLTMALACDSLKAATNGGSPPGIWTLAPMPPCRHDSARATASPPSLRSCAEESRRAEAARVRHSTNAFSAAQSTTGGRPATLP